MTFRSRPLLDLARGRDCEARILGICNSDPATVVSCHRNGAGTGYKAPDWDVAWCCSSCHDVIDGRRDAGYYSQDVRDYFFQKAHEGTMNTMFELGLVTVGGNVPRGTVRAPLRKVLEHDGVMRR